MELTNEEKVYEILNKNNYKYIYDDNTKYFSIGIGDILYMLANIQEDKISLPVKLPLNVFINGNMKLNSNMVNLFLDPINNFEFRIDLLNDIISNHNKIKKEDILFIITSNPDLSKCINYTNYWNLYRFKINVNNNLFLKNEYENFIIFHTKLRLTSSYNYTEIKQLLKTFFYNLKIKNKTIIILGERNFPKTWEGEIHKITTIYDELLELKHLNSNLVDLTVPVIYNKLDYKSFKRDISLINKAEVNICFGCGGHVSTSIFFGKCMFFDPTHERIFYRNMNLYNSEHRYFKRLEPMLRYIEEFLI